MRDEIKFAEDIDTDGVLIAWHNYSRCPDRNKTSFVTIRNTCGERNPYRAHNFFSIRLLL